MPAYVLARLALSVATRNAASNGVPKRLGIAQVPATGVPVQSWNLLTERPQGHRSKALTLVLLDGVWLIDPGCSAVRAHDVLDGKCELPVEVRLPAPPAEVPA